MGGRHGIAGVRPRGTPSRAPERRAEVYRYRPVPPLRAPGASYHRPLRYLVKSTVCRYTSSATRPQSTVRIALRIADAKSGLG